MIKVRTLVVDDNSVFAHCVTCLLQCEPWLEVVGQACSGREALDLEEHLKPDLVLTDWNMPDLNGLEVTKRIKAQAGGARVIMLTSHCEPEYVAAARNAGADGFITKAESIRKLIPCIVQMFPEVSEADV